MNEINKNPGSVPKKYKGYAGFKFEPVKIFIGQRLRALRRKNKVSQEVLGKFLGISFQQIQKYENGYNNISSGVLFMVSKYLDAPITYFFPEQDASIEDIAKMAKEEKEKNLAFLSPQEKRLLTIYRQLPKDVQDYLEQNIKKIFRLKRRTP